MLIFIKNVIYACSVCFKRGNYFLYYRFLPTYVRLSICLSKTWELFPFSQYSWLLVFSNQSSYNVITPPYLSVHQIRFYNSQLCPTCPDDGTYLSLWWVSPREGGQDGETFSKFCEFSVTSVTFSDWFLILCRRSTVELIPSMRWRKWNAVANTNSRWDILWGLCICKSESPL